MFHTLRLEGTLNVKLEGQKKKNLKKINKQFGLKIVKNSKHKSKEFYRYVNSEKYFKDHVGSFINENGKLVDDNK